MTFRRVILPLALPALVAGLDLHVLADARRLHRADLVSSTQFIGNVVYANVGIANNLPLAAAFATVPVAIMLVYLLIARRLGAFEYALMHAPLAPARRLRSADRHARSRSRSSTCRWS